MTSVQNLPRVVKLNPYTLIHRAVSGFSISSSKNANNSKRFTWKPSFSLPKSSPGPPFLARFSPLQTPARPPSGRRGGGKLKLSPPPESRPCLALSAPSLSPLTKATPGASSVSSTDKKRRHGSVCCAIRTPHSAFSSNRDFAKSYQGTCLVAPTTMKLRERIVLGKSPVRVSKRTLFICLIPNPNLSNHCSF